MFRRLKCLISGHQWKPEEEEEKDIRQVCTHCGAHLRHGRGDPNFHPGSDDPQVGDPDNRW